MKITIINENFGVITPGPARADIVAPTAQPETAPFHTSCFALNFSTTHSIPPNNALNTAKFLAHERDLDMVDLYPIRTCSLNGACGTSLPFTIWIGLTSPLKDQISSF